MTTEEISVGKTRDTEDGWLFDVRVGSLGVGTAHSVELEKNYWEELTDGKAEPELLIRNSFEFLLEREPKESILPKFNLKVIQKHFPEYEEKIKT